MRRPRAVKLEGLRAAVSWWHETGACCEGGDAAAWRRRRLRKLSLVATESRRSRVAPTASLACDGVTSLDQCQPNCGQWVSRSRAVASPQFVKLLRSTRVTAAAGEEYVCSCLGNN
jgi:hypothetical protein